MDIESCERWTYFMCSDEYSAGIRGKELDAKCLPLRYMEIGNFFFLFKE